MPRALVDDEDEDVWESGSLIEKTLRYGSLIERIGSFYPPKRKGYSDSRVEMRIQKSVAQTLYHRRITIARSIASSSYDKQDEILNEALVKAGIAPNSVSGWKDYISLIVEREGGWDIFLRRIREDVDAINYYQKTILSNWIISWIAGIMSFVFPWLMKPFIDNDSLFMVISSISLSVGIVVIAFMGLYSNREVSSYIRDVVGRSVKDSSSFIKSERVQAMK